MKYIRPQEPLASKETRADLAGAGMALDPALIVIDGVTEAFALHGWDARSETDTANYHRLLLRGFETATLEIDHTAKAAGRGQLGSQHKRAGIDGASYEFRVGRSAGRGGHSFAEVRVSKDRHGYVRHLATADLVGLFHLDTTNGREGSVAYVQVPGWSVVASPAEHTRDRILSWLADHPGSSTRAVRSGVGGMGKMVVDTLASLDADGVVRSEPGPRNSKLWTVVHAGNSDS